MPVPRPAGYDVIVKVAVASHCHTDGNVARGVFGTKLPVTASHEGSGTVVAVGPDVQNFQPGDRIMCGLPLHPCDSCLDCIGSTENWRQYCPNIEGQAGVHLDGCMAEYVRVDARTSTPLPEGVSFLAAAPLACAGRTIYRALVQTELEPGEWVAMIGSGGGLGHLGIQFAKAMGFKVFAVDARDEGLKLSKVYGADIVVDARKGKDAIVREIEKVTGGSGADSSIVITDAHEGTGLAAAVTKMHGVVVQVALPENVSVPFHDIIFRDIRIKGTLIASPEESKEMLKFVVDHGIKVKTNPFYGLESIHELLRLVESGKIQGKAVLVVDPEQVKGEGRIGAKL